MSQIIFCLSFQVLPIFYSFFRSGKCDFFQRNLISRNGYINSYIDIFVKIIKIYCYEKSYKNIENYV